VQVTLGAVNASHGGLEVVPGTHRQGRATRLLGEAQRRGGSAEGGEGGKGGEGGGDSDGGGGKGGDGGKAGQAASSEPSIGGGVALVPLPPGSVTLYAPTMLHRGLGNTNAAGEPEGERMTLSFTLLGVGALLPPGMPYTIEPGDAWRWQLELGDGADGSGRPRLVERSQRPLGMTEHP